MFIIYVKVNTTDGLKLAPRNIRKVQSFADQIHCLIYVISAKTNIYTKDPTDALSIIKEFRQNRKGILHLYITSPRKHYLSL